MDKIKQIFKSKDKYEIFENIGKVEPKKLLYLSCRYGFSPGVKLAIERGACTDIGFRTSLNSACKRNDIDLIKFVLNYNANINEEEGEAIRIASENGHLETVSFLLEKGAKIHYKNNYALRWAYRNRHIRVVKLLLSNGADINSII